MKDLLGHMSACVGLIAERLNNYLLNQEVGITTP